MSEYVDKLSVNFSVFVGEHVDYCGYSVLPMAVEQTIIIAAHVISDDKIFLSNKDPEFE